MTFQDLFSHPEILQTISEAGYKIPTEIQKQAIPEVIQGKDIQACAQTGTGKTAAFILPALLKMITPSSIKAKGPRVLILVPTRELAMQVASEAMKYSKGFSMIKTVCIYGGQSFSIQNKELSRHYEILVATPGRLIDHMERGNINFSRLEMFILDEADRMLDMGFIDDVEHIAESTPETRQTLMFSATLKPSVLKLSKRLLKNPIEIRVTPQIEEHKLIDQKLHFVDNLSHKYKLLEELLSDPAINQAVVFTATKRCSEELAEKLQECGHKAAALHGDLKQSHRTRTIGKMRQGKIRILVATDVAARGIDVPTISHVFNFDLPNNAEDYVHRIGRTGRAGATGLAISFIAPKDKPIVREIERFLGKKLLPENQEETKKEKPKKAFAPSPKKKRDHFKKTPLEKGQYFAQKERRREEDPSKFQAQRNKEQRNKESGSQIFHEDDLNKRGNYFKKQRKRFVREKGDEDFKGSNIHRQKAKRSSSHSGQNAPFPRKRSSPVHRQNVVKRKNIPFLPTET